MKQKTRILIYILIAIAVVIMGSIAILSNQQTEESPSAQEHLDLGRIYLTDLSYDKAVLEFTEAINIEPLNADAYLGLADAYEGVGDTDKAAEILEEGYEKTGDERLKKRLDEIRPPVTETSVTTAVTTEETTTTVSTVALVAVPNLTGLSEEEAVAACENAGLNYSISYANNDSVAKGYVMAQTIPESSNVAEGISVPFTVSEGAKEVTTVTTTVATTSAPVEEFITIQGVRYSTNLTQLDLTCYRVTDNDIKELDKMINLESLTLIGTYITNVNVLKNLTGLKEISITESQINDISELKGLTNLTILNLRSNQISDISALKGLTNLTELYLDGNQISDISSLKRLTNLKELTLAYNQIKDINSLSSLKNLQNLRLDYNEISSLTALKKLEALKSLYLGNNQINDIKMLSSLVNLETLDLTDNQIKNIDSLSNMTKYLLYPSLLI